MKRNTGAVTLLKLSVGLVNRAKCGAGAVPVPKAPTTPALSRKSESKIKKPFAAVGDKIGTLRPEYPPLEPVSDVGEVPGPRYSKIAFEFGVNTLPLTLNPCCVQPAGIPPAKSTSKGVCAVVLHRPNKKAGSVMALFGTVKKRLENLLHENGVSSL